MASKIGFKRMTIRVLDGKAAAGGDNLFVIEGRQDKGATQTAKINGLSSDATKTYGSDVAYYVSRKGVGDVTVDLELLDVPDDVVAKILGYQVKNGITLVGAETEAPYCSILMESTTLDGKTYAYGFFKGTFSMDSEEIKTLEEKLAELESESFKFTAIAADSEDYKGQYMGKLKAANPQALNTFKQALSMVAAG